MRCSSRLAALCLAAALAWAAAAGAQDKCAAGDFGTRLVARYQEQCWEKDAQLAARVAEIRKELEGAAGAQRLEAARSSVGREAGRLPAPGAQPASAPYIELLRQRVAGAQGALAALPGLGRIDDEAGRRYLALQIAHWPPVQNRASYGENYLEAQNCEQKDDQDAACAAVYAKAVEIADAMFLMRNLMFALRQPLREELRDQLVRRTARWESYLYDSQFQYWWELGLNRWLEEKCPDGPNAVVDAFLEGDECRDLKRDRYGNPEEWREPPRYRAIALHPDIGFMYKRDEPDGDRMKPSLVFQWFGYQWWRWGEDGKGTGVHGLRGLSIVSTVSDNVTGSAIGLGLQVQYNEYALALTSHGGKPVLTFSFKLLDRVAKLDQAWADKLRRQ